MSTLTQEHIDRLTRAYARDPRPYIEALLWIRPKTGGKLIPFRLTKPQQRLLDLVMKMLAEGRPVRIIILKPRQLGFSTLIQALMHWYIQVTRQVNCLTMAHKSGASKILFQIFLRFQDALLPEFRPMVKARNEALGFIEFGNPDPKTREENPGLQSRVAVETAEAPDAGRSGTVQFLHGSEVAFYPNREVLNAMLQAVPDIGAHVDPDTGEWNPGTFVFLESTANGASGDFYEMCQRARRGEGDFVFFFVPWFEQEEYRRPVSPEEEQAWRRFKAAHAIGAAWDNRVLKLTKEEIDLIERYHLDFGQIKWRRATIATKCQGDVAKFKQEYPSNPDEAFLASGSPWFDLEQVIRAKEAAERRPEPERFRIDEAASARFGRPVVIPDPNGELKVWRRPDRRRLYVAGADVSEGGAKGDADCCMVLDHEELRHVAELHGQFNTSTYARKLYWLGMWYNKALLGVERNSMGVAVVERLADDLRYPNLYGPKRDELMDDEPYEWGWRTTQATRPLLVTTIQEAVNEGSLRSDSVAFWDECLSFKRNEKGRPEAESGKQDDRVMAMAIALKVRDHMPARVRVAAGGTTTAPTVHRDLAALRRSQLPV